MLIKPTRVAIDTQEDIHNISNRRRTIIIYRYTKPHNTEFCYFRDYLYDIFILTHSALEGINYILPKDNIMYFRNTYRGCIRNPFLPDGSLDMSAEISFLNGWFATRYVNPYMEALWVDRSKYITNNGVVDHLNCESNNDILEPLPLYYTFEDQVRLEPAKSYRDFDFNNCYMKDVPLYHLGDFKDKYTRFVIIDLEEEDILASGGFNQIYQPAVKQYQESAREIISTAFVQCLEIVTNSIFSQVAIVFDLEAENTIFNIDRSLLRLKYDYRLSKQDITNEYGKLITSCNIVGESLSDLLFDHYKLTETMPTRIHFFISDTINKVILGKSKTPQPIKHSVGYSTSDCDEQLYRYAMGQYPFEFMENNPDIQRDIAAFSEKLRKESL